MADKFKSGDAVQLKSGGPKMTVSGKNRLHPNLYDCKWFAGSKLNEGRFGEEELQAYQEDSDKKAKK